MQSGQYFRSDKKKKKKNTRINKGFDICIFFFGWMTYQLTKYNLFRAIQLYFCEIKPHTIYKQHSNDVHVW